MSAPLHDLRAAARGLARRPGFTALAVLTMALSVGAGAAIFGLADAVAFRPLPVRDPDRLVAVFGTRPDGPVMPFSHPDARDLRAATGDVFEGLAVFTEQPVSAATDRAEAAFAWTMLVDGDYFDVVGVRPAAGRTFGAEEERSGERVAVVSQGFAESRYGGAERALGTTLRINRAPFTVVGVAPAGFQGTRLFSYAPEIWVPATTHRAVIPGSDTLLENRRRMAFHVVARLAPGVDRETATSVVAAAAERLGRAFPDDTVRDGVTLISNRTPINPWAAAPAQFRGMGFLALGGVAVLLLVTCANLANLLLVRAAGRRRELGIRASLGAGRTRLLRPVIAESVLLGTAACLAGLTVGAVAIPFAGRLAPDLAYPPAVDVRMDLRVALFVVATTFLTTLLAGAAPALRSARFDPARQIREDGGAGQGAGRLRSGLVVAQVALGLVLLAASGLMVRSLHAAGEMELGFDPEGAVVVGVDPGLEGAAPAEVAALQRRIAARLEALPGVSGVTWADDLPLDGNSSSTNVRPEGLAPSDEPTEVVYQSVGSSYFGVLGIPVVEGRSFEEGDEEREVEAVVVGRALAGTLWPDRPAVGQRLRLGGSGALLEVVGVVADAKLNWLGEAPRPALFFDIRRNPTSRVLFVVRHRGSSAATAGDVRKAIAEIDPALPLLGPETLRAHISPAFAGARNGAALGSAFGLLALVLAVTGLYGVVAFGVAQRVREIGIRIAVGAAPGRVVRETLSGALRLYALGAVLGLLGAVALGRLLEGFLYGVGGQDPLVLVATVAGLALATLASAWIPARRAAAIDPREALKS